VDGTYDPGNGDFSAIMDASGDVLDGEFTYLMPTGDGEPGGNLLYRFDLGDAGDTAANATDLTHTDALPAGTYRPLLMYNEVKGFRGTIGDNPNLLGINRANDVDVYRVDAVQGDILYVAVDDPFAYYVQVWTWDGAAWVEEFPDSLSGEGYYTEALTETYRVSVCTNTMGDWVWNPVTTLWEYVPPGVVDITTENSTEGETTGLYELYLHLFDDYNSNFTTTPLGANFDATQTPTPLTWVGNTAMPQSIDADSRAVQVISTPDDVDIYRLDNVPDLTRLDLLVKSWSIGSGLDPYVALFNADGALVSSIGFPGGTGLADVWRTPEGYLDTPIISAYVPDATPGPGGSATYYVAIWGGDLVGPFDGEIAYELTVTKTEPNQPGWTAPAWALPVRPPQTVYLNFRGGDEAFLVDAFGPGTEPYVDPFQASVFGFGLPAENIQMINQIANQVRGIYAGYNITFTTERPLVGEYTEIKISGAQAPQVGVYGLAEQIDPLNTDLTDVAVVWAGEMADNYNVALGYTMAEIAEYVGGTAAHELGHLLGLNHNTDPFAFPTLLMEPFTSPGPYAFGTGALVEYLVGYQTDSVLLRAIA